MKTENKAVNIVTETSIYGEKAGKGPKRGGVNHQGALASTKQASIRLSNLAGGGSTAPPNPRLGWEGEDCDEEEEEKLEGGGDPVGEEVLEPREDLPRDLDGHDAHAAAGTASVPSRL